MISLETTLSLLKERRCLIIEKEREVVYIAELDADVDDVIAAEYLHNKGVLKEVVCDPFPKTPEGKDRKEQLEKLGIKASNKIPPIAKYVFVGGALTELARYLINHKIECLVMNGGFVGCNIVRNPLDKFKDKQVIRTFNFNCDVVAADSVLKSKNIENIILVGKNVCHSEKMLSWVFGVMKRDCWKNIIQNQRKDNMICLPVEKD